MLTNETLYPRLITWTRANFFKL